MSTYKVIKLLGELSITLSVNDVPSLITSSNDWMFPEKVCIEYIKTLNDDMWEWRQITLWGRKIKSNGQIGVRECSQVYFDFTAKKLPDWLQEQISRHSPKDK